MARLAKVARAAFRRAGVVFWRVLGREPGLTWKRLLTEFSDGLARMNRQRRSAILRWEPAGDFCRVTTIAGDVLYWPASYDLGVIDMIYRELSFPEDPNNYFSLYKPGAGDVVLDIGACEGLFSYRLRHAVSRLYLAEPTPRLTEALSLTFREEVSSGRVVIVGTAFSDRDGTANLVVDEGLVAANYLSDGPSGQASGEAVVGVSTIDSFVKKEGIGQLDLIKMDVEGSEMRVLRGAEETMATLQPRFLVTTYHLPEDIPDIPDFFRDHGYEVAGATMDMYLRRFRPPHFRPRVIFARPAEHSVSRD